MKYIYNFLVLSLALAGNTVMAQEVSVDVAKNRALDFLSNQTADSKRAKGTKSLDVTLAYTSKSADKTCFYVFNAGEDDGFVIIGGDEAAREILGYCDHGSFDYETAPANFKWWLSQYTDQIAQAEVSATSATSARRAKTANRTDIPAIIEAKWNQNDPYNSKIVSDAGDKGFMTGCVATAMAQMMYHYKHPAQGIGSHSYTSGNGTFSANFGNTSYYWDNMLAQYDNSATQNQKDAVATLMFHVGVSVDMNYGLSSSGANSAKIGYALVNYFGYDKSVRNEYRSYFNDGDWENLVYNELTAGRPVFYCGDAENGAGHQFICDGYDLNKDMFRFNWGWGGYCDGSYKMTGTDALKPNGSGIGGAGGNSSYTQGQMIILNVMKPSGNAENAHIAQIALENINAMCLEVGSTTSDTHIDYDRSENTYACKIYTTIYNLSCLTEDFDYGVKAIGEKGNIYYSTSLKGQNLERGHFWQSSFALSFNPAEWEEDTYELRPVARKAGQTDEDWTEFDKLLDETYPTITIIGEPAPATETIELTNEPYFNNDNNVYIDDLVLHYTIRNGKSEESDATIYIYLSSDYYLFPLNKTHYSLLPGQAVDGTINLNSYNFKDDEGSFKINKYLTAGKTYYLAYSTIGKPDSPNSNPSISFTYRDKLTIKDYQVCPAGYGTIILPFNAELPEGMTAVYTCTGVDNNGVLTLVEEESIRRNVPYIVKADPEKGPYTFVGPKAIDDNNPSFHVGIMEGAVANNVPLIANDDYILQYQNNVAAFYKYTGTLSEDPNENEGDTRLATQFRAFLRPNVTTGAPSYALPADTEEGIELINVDTFKPAGIYSIDGKRQNEFKKGMNVIILEDGTVQKIYVK